MLDQTAEFPNPYAQLVEYGLSLIAARRLLRRSPVRFSIRESVEPGQLILRKSFVWIAVQPALARLSGRDYRMVRRARVPGGVAVW